jgi:hypothetical protein
MADEQGGFWRRQNLISILPTKPFGLAQKAYLRAINEFQGNDGNAYPSLSKIAQSMGCAESTVDARQKEMIELGIVICNSAKGSGCGRSNRYLIDTAKLSQFVPNTPRAGVFTESNTPPVGEIIPREPGMNTPTVGDKLPITTIEQPISSSEDSEGTSTTAKKSKAETYSTAFLDWWAVYPRKVAKRDAQPAFDRAIKRIVKDHTSKAAAITWLLEVTTVFGKSPSGNKGEYTPHPATWLNEGRYEDDQAEWGGTTSSGRKSADFETVRAIVKRLWTPDVAASRDVVETAIGNADLFRAAKLTKLSVIADSRDGDRETQSTSDRHLESIRSTRKAAT